MSLSSIIWYWQKLGVNRDFTKCLWSWLVVGDQHCLMGLIGQGRLFLYLIYYRLCFREHKNVVIFTCAP